jgi:hypothetical protein
MSPVAASADRPAQESSESEICLTCGFCCDGTLFDHVVSGPGDTTDSLIAIGLTPINASPHGSTGFRLPCRHFIGHCSIYTSPRPWACGAFRCRLLRSVKRGKYTVTQALQIVRETRALRAALVPVFDGLYADALTEGAGTDIPELSLVSRLLVVVPLLVRPESVQFREKYSKALMSVFRLASRLTNDFLPKSPDAEKDFLA